MKNYKQILEAINRGIQLALDDYEDNEPNSSISQHNDVIDSDDVIKHKVDLMKEVVDLGLPSRTLWCKYNLGVNSNQLNTPEDWYGGYYAWGEIEANKQIYDWDHYKFGNEQHNLTKYCNDLDHGLHGFTDNLTQLLPEDDAAYQNKHIGNFKFHIPTKEQCEELINYTNNYWINDYNPNKLVHNQDDDGGIQGLNGRIFIGKNGNQLFIPAAGFRGCSDIINVGSSFYVWSSSLKLDDTDHAYKLYFYSTLIGMYGAWRCNGFSVRPVINL